MFADDVSLFSSHPYEEVAEAAMQEAITNVAEWSRCRKITLNTSKFEVAFYTNSGGVWRVLLVQGLHGH